jgi:transcriptional regulator with XRE-family HTH domain
VTRLAAVAKAHRLSLKMTQAELARRCGVSLHTIFRIENCQRSMSVSLLVRLARALGPEASAELAVALNEYMAGAAQ